jgi:ATP-dependent Zn protease
MKNLLKNISIVLILFVFVAAISILYSSPQTKSQAVSLSNLVGEINDGKIKEISVDSDNLKITLNDGTVQTSTKEKEIGLTESLKNYGVDGQKLSVINIDVKGESSTSFWLANILPF